mmetsp:Transcript_113833/g.361821  ORF Transcript_113833/g.361821 Transcript_113833/m.361821 type:complete len:270 (-) Transcript_113833:552-1361(-)
MGASFAQSACPLQLPMRACMTIFATIRSLSMVAYATNSMSFAATTRALQNRCLRKRLPNQGHTSTTATAYHLVQRTRLTVSSLRTEKSKHVSAARLARSRMHRGQSNSSTAKSWPSTWSEMPSASGFLQLRREAPSPQDRPANVEGLKELRQPCARPCKVRFGPLACKLHRIAWSSLQDRLAVHAKMSHCARTCEHAEIDAKPSPSTVCASFQAMAWRRGLSHTSVHQLACLLSWHTRLQHRRARHLCFPPCSSHYSSTIVADDGPGQG